MDKKEDEGWIWHRICGHASMHVISKLSQNDLVVGLTKLNFENDKICDACVSRSDNVEHDTTTQTRTRHG